MAGRLRKLGTVSLTIPRATVFSYLRGTRLWLAKAWVCRIPLLVISGASLGFSLRTGAKLTQEGSPSRGDGAGAVRCWPFLALVYVHFRQQPRLNLSMCLRKLLLCSSPPTPTLQLLCPSHKQMNTNTHRWSPTTHIHCPISVSTDESFCYLPVKRKTSRWHSWKKNVCALEGQ